MKPARSIQIGATTYAVTPVGAGIGLQVAARLAHLIAPMLAAGGGGDPKEVGARVLRDFLQSPALFDHVKFLCDSFALGTVIQGQGGAPVQLSTCFDVHFAGDYGALLEWLAFALEVNMSSFFAVSPSLKARVGGILGVARVSNAPTPAEATG